MDWSKASRFAAACLCLIPLKLLAQDETPSDDPAPEASSEASPPEEQPSTMETVKGAAEDVKEKAQELNEKARGILGDFRVGPSVAVGIPHPLTAGIDVVYADLVNISVAGGRFGTTVDETDLEIRNWDITARWFPFRGSFYLGAGYGKQGIVGKTTSNVDLDYNGVTLSVPTTIRLEVESSYLSPQLGWFARWDSGFTMGFELGYIMPSGASSELQTSFRNVSAAAEQAVRDSEDYKKSKKDVEDLGKQLGETGLPYITLIRLGWLF